MTVDASRNVGGQIHIRSNTDTPAWQHFDVEVTLGSTVPPRQRFDDELPQLTSFRTLDVDIPIPQALDKAAVTNVGVRVYYQRSTVSWVELESPNSLIDVPAYTASFDRRVETALGGGAFTSTDVTLDEEFTEWTRTITTPALGEHVVRARALQGTEVGAAVSHAFEVVEQRRGKPGAGILPPTAKTLGEGPLRRSKDGTMRARVSLLVAVAMVAAFGVAPASAGTAAAAGEGSPNVDFVKNIEYEARYNGPKNMGTDIEFADLVIPRNSANLDMRGGEIESAFAGSYRNGLQIIDITEPAQAEHASVWDCAVAQGDVQIFTRALPDDYDPREEFPLEPDDPFFDDPDFDEDEFDQQIPRVPHRTYATFTADTGYGTETIRESQCFRDVNFSFPTYGTTFGTMIADVTDPYAPKTVGFVPVEDGSHNTTVHPSGLYLYNSNSNIGPLDRLTAPATWTGTVEVYDISDLEDLPKTPDTILPLHSGLDSHDITFDEAGDRAYIAALTHTLVADTTDPLNPTILGRIVDPAINIHHQSDPVTITDPILGERTFVIVTDEVAGAAGNGYCPGGGLHIYDVTGDLERAPVKVGFWAIPDTSVQEGPAHGVGVAGVTTVRCTSHVLRAHPDEAILTIGWYSRGVRVVDISDLVGVSVGIQADQGNVGEGMREIGYFEPPDADTWSAKTNKIDEDGSFYLYGNDLVRGLDIYHFDADAAQSGEGGTWLNPAQALQQALQVNASYGGQVQQAPYCVLGL